MKKHIKIIGLIFIINLLMTALYSQSAEGISEKESTGSKDSKLEENEKPEVLSNESLGYDLGEVEVIGKKNQKNPNLTEKRVSKRDIRDFNAHDLTSALNLLTSISRKTTGSRNESSISLRGFDVKGVPVFVDGIPVYTPYDGYPDLSRFFIFDIEQIAVSRSFSSVLYGPNTIGGAINIITNKPDKPFEAEIETGYETMDQYHTYAKISSLIHSFFFNAAASYVDRTSFVLADDYENEKDVAESKYRKNSYQKNQKVSYRTGFAPDKNQDYALTYIYMKDIKGNPVYAGDNPSVKLQYQKWDYWIKQSMYYNTFNQFSTTWYMKNRFYFDQYKNKLSRYDDETYSTMEKKYAFESIYDDYTYGGSMENGFELSKSHTLRSSVHYKSDNHRSHNVGELNITSRDYIISCGIEDTYYIIPEQLYTIAGIGFDYTKTVQAEELVKDVPTSFSNLSENIAYNPQAGLFYRFTPENTVFLTVSHKNRLPTLEDRYSYKAGRGLPNSKLKPERAVQTEAGWIRDVRRMKSTLTLFYADIYDMIASTIVEDPEDSTSTLLQNKNIDHVRMYGAEAELEAKIIPRWIDGGVRYQFVDRYAVSKSTESDDPMSGIAKHTFFTFIKVYWLPELTWLIDLEYNDKRFAEDVNHNRYYTDYFILINSKLSYDLTRSFTASVFINNITDALYEIDEGYPMPGRTYGFTMNYHM